VQQLWVFERASERILVTWTASQGGVVLIVITEDGTTRCRSFGGADAFNAYRQQMQATLREPGWVCTRSAEVRQIPA
jgi:hypothetical protein